MFCKVCGLRRQEDLDLAMDLDVRMCGFIFHPKSPRYIEPQDAAVLQSGTMLRVGVFVDHNADEIKRIMDVARLDLAQLHGQHSIECAEKIGVDRVIRVLWPEKYTSLDELLDVMDTYAGSCAYYLLDAGKSGGGSGKHLNWNSLKTMQTPHPWMLAGGLQAEALCKVFYHCIPDGVDCNSGIEDAPAIKNKQKMANVMHIVKNMTEQTLENYNAEEFYG